MSNESFHMISWRKMCLARAKLKASSRTSALLSGFAMVAMVEVDLSDADNSSGLLIAFSIITTLVVTVHLLALMISTCILPNLEAVYSVNNFAAVVESPHEKLSLYIELAWIFSTGIGILLFLAQMAILAWVRFGNKTQHAAIASTVILVPSVFIFIVFAVHFYRQLIEYKYERTFKGLADIREMAAQIETVEFGKIHNI